MYLERKQEGVLFASLRFASQLHYVVSPQIILLLLSFTFSALVCCTDLPEVVPLIELNRATNQHMITGTFTATSLKW